MQNIFYRKEKCCAECIEESKRMKATLGYCKSYVGTENDCLFHKKTKKSQPVTTETEEQRYYALQLRRLHT